MSNDFEARTVLVPVALVFLFLILFLFERRFPLRHARYSSKPRLRTNVSMAFVATVATRILTVPWVVLVARHVEAKQWGILPHMPLPPIAAFALGLVLLDYSLYLWHRMNHKIPFLWRFHGAHHTDPDLDVSTAIRFHVGELFLSAGYRSLSLLVIGAGPAILVTFETLVTAAAFAHHANIKLPVSWERILVLLTVTPRMHGVHHSSRRDECDSNFSTLLPLWDRLHGTLRLNIPQHELLIGVAGIEAREGASFVPTLVSPAKSPHRWPHDACEARVGTGPREQLAP